MTNQAPKVKGLAGRQLFHWKVVLLNQANSATEEVDFYSYWAPEGRWTDDAASEVARACAAQYAAASSPVGQEKAPIIGVSAVLQ